MDTNPSPSPARFAGEIGDDHPGFTDPEYRDRRATIASLAESYVLGDPVPEVPYSDAEHRVWSLVTRGLRGRHKYLAIDELVEAGHRLDLPTDHLPQLDEVSALLEPLTGFRYAPVAGLVPPDVFYGGMADGVFRSTQYIRHASAPYYTPEPDVIHEVVGHATHLASDRFAALYREVGRAVRRCETDEAIELVSRLFWFTMEFGAMREDGEVKAYGAGLLSSVGEIHSFTTATELRPFDLVEMGATSYDITRFQDTLFVADSLDQLEDELGSLLEGFDDESATRFLRDEVSAA